jgi:trigger factor
MALIEGCKHSLDLTIPAAQIQAETERLTLEYQKKAHLQGFRPGKAPLSIIRQNFAGRIQQDVLEALVPKAIDAKFQEERLNVVGQPEVKDFHLHDGQEAHFKVEFEVAPEIELGEYRNLEVAYAEPAVADADIEAELNRLRNEKAEFINEDPRAAQDGDHVLVAIESTGGVAEPVKSDSLPLEVGSSETLPEFSEALRGLSPEESKELTVTYPEDYGSENLSGKTVEFRMTLKQIRRKELPELNDEFAKDLGDYQTMDDLRSSIRNQLFRNAENEAQEAAKNKLVDGLVTAHEFPVPNAYVDTQLRNSAEQLLRSLASQGADPRALNFDFERFKESQKDRAVRDVRASLLLDTIATRESIDAMQDEVDRELQVAARRERQPVAALRAQWEKSGMLRRVASHIRTAKTLNFLFENARKVAPVAEAASE